MTRFLNFQTNTTGGAKDLEDLYKKVQMGTTLASEEMEQI